MTKNQAYMVIARSQVTAKQHSDCIMAAHSQYFVRKQNGRVMLDSVGKPVETDDLAFALAAAYNCSGAVVDRWNWRKA